MTVGLVPGLTDEQAMLVDASVRFMESEVPISVIRARADGATRDDAGYRSSAAELGWFGLLADSADGGGSASGNGVLDAAVVAAERGARLQPGPFAGHTVVVHTLSTTGSQASVLAELIGGDTWATWAFEEKVSCALSVDGDGFRLDGTIPVVAELQHCGWILLSARAPQGLAQVLVRTDLPGVTIRSREGLDVTRTWGALQLDGVRVATDDIVGTPGPDTDELIDQQARLAAVLTAAESVGSMCADFASAVQYAKDRIAFGRPIGSFQGLKHLIADTSLGLEMSMGLVAAAAGAVGADAPDGAELAHAAKAFVAEQGVELAHNCFQVYGGIGYTWEHDQHLYLRRLAADAASFGSARWHRAQLLDVAGVA